MSIPHHKSTNNVQCDKTEYKINCDGKNCKNVGEYHLKIKYIKRSGWFCQICLETLETDGLVESVFHDDVMNEGENKFGEG